MSRFLKWVGLVVGIVGIGIAVLGIAYDWPASRYTIVLTFSCLTVLFFGFAGFGGTGPGMGLGGVSAKASRPGHAPSSSCSRRQ